MSALSRSAPPPFCRYDLSQCRINASTNDPAKGDDGGGGRFRFRFHATVLC